MIYHEKFRFKINFIAFNNYLVFYISLYLSRICFAFVFDKLYYICILWPWFRLSFNRITWRSGIQNSTRGICFNLIFQLLEKLHKFYGVIAID